MSSLSMVIGQDELNCIEIDFEEIDGSTPFEGLIIRDQFFGDFGMTFEREDGGFPVIAEVGGSYGQAAAFSSFWGEDTPAPGVDIGRYFLTDDGMLTGTDPPPLIVRFSFPLDSISGCNLDIDGGEEFIIQARGINDEVIQEFVIADGDPGTGDGALTCWGFNLQSCEEKIYSVRWEGTRPFPSFGLGIDNLSFCFSVNSVSANATCNADNGVITLTSSGSVFEYSLDGITYQSSPVFDGLGPDLYLIYVRDGDGCVYTITVPVFEIPPVTIDNAIIQNTSCGENNGAVTVEATPTMGNIYSINAFSESQISPTFEDLPPGEYTIFVIDNNGCTDSYDVEVLPSIIPTIDVQIENEFCDSADGRVELSSTTTNGMPTYQIEDLANQTSPIFENLSAGSYTFSVIDSDNCRADTIVTLDNIFTTEVDDAIITDATCNDKFGSIEIFAINADGVLTYSLDSSGVFQLSNTFDNVSPGMHTIFVDDDQGCRVPFQFEIDIPDCAIFVPNIFCPTCGVSGNDEFSIATTELYDICIIKYEIYDRWGNLIYFTDKFSIHSGFGSWWDGTFDGVPAEVGVYVYLIEVIHENEKTEILTGDITLVR